MMKFTTPISIPPSIHPISYDSRVWFMGSCFATNIGRCFQHIKIPTVVNPFGTLFSPYSVMKAMKRIISKEYFTSDDFMEIDGMYVSLDLHSDHSYSSVKEAVETVNTMIDSLHADLQKTTHIFFTFGTPQVYRYKKTGEICANCHKIPQKEFSIESMTIEQIYDRAMDVEKSLRSINSCIKIYYTISPVRYMGYGALGNSVGKSRLFCAVDKILENNKESCYFPSYEIMMDELRDYRYYAEDMIHPSSQAVEYIWEKIKNTFFAVSTHKLCEQVETIIKNVSHRPKNPQGEQYMSFCTKNLQMIEEMMEKYPQIDFCKEREYFISRLKLD